MECIIIGGGIIGMFTARELALAGCRVRIIERGTLGGESSWAGGGILSPLYPWRVQEPVTRLAQWSQARYPGLAAALAEATGIDPEWVRSGLLILEAGDTDRARSWAQQHQITVELLEGEQQIAGIEPACRPVERALWLPEVAQVRNPRLIRSLKADLEQRGVAISEHTAVTAILHSDGIALGVRTEKQIIRADVIVVAAGAWSARVLDKLGIRVEVKPVRGQMLLYRAGPGLIRRILLAGGHYAIPRRDGCVLIGSTVEDAGFEKETTAAARQELQAAAESLVPELARCNIEQHWSGLRPGSPQEIPYTGAVPGMERLYLNAGHFRNGLLLAPASARLLSDIILSRKTELNPSSYGVR